MEQSSERFLLSEAKKLVRKWRSILQLDPLWIISVEALDDEEIEGATARVETTNTQYFTATIEINNTLLYLSRKKLLKILESLICHELLHLVMIDFYRTARFAAGKRSDFIKELDYKFEQFTSRLQSVFLNLDKRLQEKRHREKEEVK